MSVNEDLQRAAVDHSIDIIRYQNGIVRRIIALLNRTDADLFAQLTAALERFPQNAFTVERLEALLTSVRQTNAKAYEVVRNALEVELNQLAAYEVQYQAQLFQNVLPVTLQTAVIVPEMVASAALARPFQGRLLKEWAAGIEASKMVKIRDAIRIGYVEGQTTADIVRRIRGTKALQYKDGILETTRREAETIVRTAIAHTANHARAEFYKANDDLVKGIKWVSTLDGRTSEICQARDGQVYPVDSGPRPPAHLNCRSSTTPVLKSWRELGIDMDDMPPSTRASMDGQVPANLTYGEWLKGKDAKDPAFTDRVLGKTKAKLFRAGMPLDRFVNRTGDVLNLDELRKRDAEYFRKAGIA